MSLALFKEIDVEFQGKTALVTGASLGIGKSIAIELARQGADVAINYRSHEVDACEVKSAIEGLGRRAILVQADVADQTAVEAMVSRTVAEFGHLDCFVSNAAYSDRQPMIDANIVRFRRTVDVTMWGAFYGLRASAQQMVKQQTGGSIVIVSSPLAVVGVPTSMAYNMSKAAIDQMARTAAIELSKHRIRVNIIHPGWIDTPGERKFCSESQLKEEAAKIPWGRLGHPDEIAKSIAFLLSGHCDYMTGSTLTIDGGICLPWWWGQGANLP